MGRSQRLTKDERIRKRREFQRIQRAGVRVFGIALVLICTGSRSREGRVGFTVPKNVGKAHIRNLIKRRLRHIAREHKAIFEYRDLIILALPKALSLTFQELRDDLLSAAQKLTERSRTHSLRQKGPRHDKPVR